MGSKIGIYTVLGKSGRIEVRSNIMNGPYKMSEAARILGVHVNTLRRWSNEGVVKVMRFGPRQHRRVTAEEIERLLGSSMLNQEKENDEGQTGN